MVVFVDEAFFEGVFQGGGGGFGLGAGCVGLILKICQPRLMKLPPSLSYSQMNSRPTPITNMAANTI